MRDTAQLKLVYSTYDRLNGRTDNHLNKLILDGTNVMEDIWTSMLSKYISGMRLWHFEVDAERRRATPDQVCAVVQTEFPQLFRTVALFCQKHASEKDLLRQAPIAAMYATFNKVPTKAEEFWNPVLDGTGLDTKTDPRWWLRRHLQEVGIAAGARKTAMNNEDLYRICIQAWNKWRAGEKCQTAIRPTKERINPK